MKKATFNRPSQWDGTFEKLKGEEKGQDKDIYLHHHSLKVIIEFGHN